MTFIVLFSLRIIIIHFFKFNQSKTLEVKSKMKRVKSVFDIAKYKLIHRITLDRNKYVFPKGFPSLISEYISEKECDSILSNINLIIATQLTLASKNHKWPMYRLLIVILAVIVSNVLAGLLLAYAIQNKVSLVIFCGSLLAFSVLCSIVGIYSALRAPTSYPIVVLNIIEQINVFLDSVNQEGLDSKKPMWSLVGEFEELLKPNSISNATYLAVWGKPIQGSTENEKLEIVIPVK